MPKFYNFLAYYFAVFTEKKEFVQKGKGSKTIMSKFQILDALNDTNDLWP